MKTLQTTKQRTGRFLRSTALRPRSCVSKYSLQKPPHIKKKKKEANNCPRPKLKQETKKLLLERIAIHEEKLTKLSQLGLPIVSLEETKIQQYIKQYKAKIALHDEEHIRKIIGIVGEAYTEDPEPKSYEQKEFAIQKKVISMLIDHDIFLRWDQDKWNSLIKKSLIRLPYRATNNRNLTNQQKYQQMYATLNHIYHQNLNYSFIQNCPIQAQSDSNLDELCNIKDLHNVRAIRSYLCKVIASLEKICAHKSTIQNQNLSELYKLQTSLQENIEEFWLIKQNIFTLKNSYKPKIQQPNQTFQPKIQPKVQKQGQGTLLQFFKVIKKKVTQPDYFDILDSYITNDFQWKEKEQKH